MGLTRRGLLTVSTLASLPLLRKPARAEATELGRLMAVEPARAVPDTPFETQDGTKRRLSDYVGKPLLVNLWATWCAPCVAELPSLAALARTMGPRGIEVLPISLDRGGAAAVTAFFTAHHISGLPVLVDKSGDLMHAFEVRGLPTTYLIDESGKIVAMEEGGMDWTSPAVLARLRQLAGASSGAHA